MNNPRHVSHHTLTPHTHKKTHIQPSVVSTTKPDAMIHSIWFPRFELDSQHAKRIEQQQQQKSDKKKQKRERYLIPAT